MKSITQHVPSHEVLPKLAVVVFIFSANIQRRAESLWNILNQGATIGLLGHSDPSRGVVGSHSDMVTLPFGFTSRREARLQSGALIDNLLGVVM